MRREKHVLQYCMELCVYWRCCSCTSSIIISEITDLLLDIARLAILLSSKLKYLNLQLFKSAKGKTLYFCCKLLKNQSSYKSLFWTVKSLPVINITGRKKSFGFVLDFHSILFFSWDFNNKYWKISSLLNLNYTSECCEPLQKRKQ